MYKLLFIAIFCLFTSMLAGKVLAQDDVTTNLKKRLQESLQATSSPSPDPTRSLRAYVGTIKDMVGTTLVIDHKDGKRDIKLSEETVIIRSPGNATIKPTNINIGDSIIAIGNLDSDDILLGKRLIVSSTPISAPSKTTTMGTIKTLGKSSLTLSVTDRDQSLILTSKTIYKSPAGPIELADLSVGDTVIFTAVLDDDEATATIVMRIKTAPVTE